jgi:hypothetical protein
MVLGVRSGTPRGERGDRGVELVELLLLCDDDDDDVVVLLANGNSTWNDCAVGRGPFVNRWLSRISLCRVAASALMSDGILSHDDSGMPTS